MRMPSISPVSIRVQGVYPTLTHEAMMLLRTCIVWVGGQV